MSKEYRATL